MAEMIKIKSTAADGFEFGAYPPTPKANAKAALW